MYTFRNKSDLEQMVPGEGIVKPNETITTENKIENVNFEEVSSQQTPEQPIAAQAQTDPETPAKPEEPKGESE